MFFAHILKYLLSSFDDNVDEEPHIFFIANVQPQECCLAFAQFFCQFQPGIAYQSVAYK